MSGRAPTLLAVIRRRRPGAPVELVPPTKPTPPPTRERRPPPTVYRFPEPGSIEQLFREAQRLRS